MMAYLLENMEKDDVENITCINKRWEDIELGVDIDLHDVVIASYSLGMLDLQEALTKIDAAAKKYVFLFTSVGSWRDEELWNMIYGEKQPAWWSDYIYTYNILHDLEIYANVEISDSEFELQYDSLNEAMNNWKEMYNIPLETEGILSDYLSKILVEDGEKLCLKRKSKSAMIWWKKNHEIE